jgi:two-component system, OmpR family, copper resistance phosphate regulon response regulator CusR
LLFHVGFDSVVFFLRATLTDNTPKLRIILVEDERKLARAIGRQLERAGYEVDLAFDGESALKSITTREIHLIILDIGLPGISGLEVLQQIRARSFNTPALILTARDELKDKLKGLDLGADDYITKPFDSSELLARIQAILRRSGAIRVSILEAEDLTMDVVSRVVRRSGQIITLTQTEFALLEFFLRNKNVILTRRRIAEQVWGYKFETGTNIVDVYISYLRDSIDKNFSPKLIETIRGEGFMLKAK